MTVSASEFLHTTASGTTKRKLPSPTGSSSKAIDFTEEDVIRRRLIAEGDSGVDDKRISNLFKSFLDFCSPVPPPSNEASTNSSSKLVGDTDKEVTAPGEPLSATQKNTIISTAFRLDAVNAQCRVAAQKFPRLERMNVSQQEEYAVLLDKIDQDFDSTIRDLAAHKEALTAARKEKRNKREYTMLAYVINKHDSRASLKKQLEESSAETSALEATDCRLKKALQRRKKQFHLVNLCCNQLAEAVAKDEEADENGIVEKILPKATPVPMETTQRKTDSPAPKKSDSTA